MSPLRLNEYYGRMIDQSRCLLEIHHYSNDVDQVARCVIRFELCTSNTIRCCSFVTISNDYVRLKS
ncbi:hypothetical protein O9993_18715 [Vibrio lentus]|nr:hypothetical protein [Vibrio lentus]